jgi:hypothetical protein
MTYTIDAKTPKGQAGQMLRAIKAIAKASGLSAEYAEVRLYGEPEGGKAYQVVWEDGPFEWGVIGGNGGNIWGEEMGYHLYDKRLEPTFAFAEHVCFEHYWSFDFCFFPYD